LALEGRALLSNLIVSNTNDSGRGSLRAAINQSNADGGGDTIVFSSLFNAPQTITLTEGPLRLTNRATTTITGPGATLLTVSGNSVGRVFSVFGPAQISGLTITDGDAVAGGGILNTDQLTLNGVVVSGNSADDGGGVLNTGGTARLSMTNSTVSGNLAVVGGGLCNGFVSYLSAPGSSALWLTNCTISGNTAESSGNNVSGGGGLFNAGGCSTTMTNCTVTGNTASGNASGGGLYNYTAFLKSGTLVLTNTIVAGNGGGDVEGDCAGGNNLIGDGLGMSGIENGSNGNQVGTAGALSNPLLAPLGNYGGPTQTMALLPGSPAIGGGTTAGAPANDQRGELRSGHVDIGAFQSQGFTLTPADGRNTESTAVDKAFPYPLAVSVKADNPDEPVDGGVVTFAVMPVGGASAALSAATATIAGGRASVTATANGTIGTYQLAASAAGAGETGIALTNTETRSLKVTTQLDVVNELDGLTSLREAIAYANSHPGPDTIVFDPAFFGTQHRTIRLTGGPLTLTDPAITTIIGPGAGRLTLSGRAKSRVFDVRGGSLALDGVTITGGRADRGGGIRNNGGKLWLDHVVIRGNRARIGGGLFNNGATSFTDVVIRGNTAPLRSGVYSTQSATLTRRVLSSPKPAALILLDDFNGNGGVPNNWMQIFGGAGDVSEQPYQLTLTDSTGASAGIASNLQSSVFSPLGVTTAIHVIINSVNADGNAIFGIIGRSAKGFLTGYLAVGIDAQGDVFIVEQSPSIPQRFVPIGTDKSYTGGSTQVNFTIDPLGVTVSTPGFNSGRILFNRDLNRFSLAEAFGNRAIPALVGASQPNDTGGSANFRLIQVTTIATARRG
jgi:hypothetical protein